MTHPSSSVLFREIHKNAWLKKIPGPLKKMPLSKKATNLWAVFCVHDDVDPFLEFYLDPEQSAVHKPDEHVALNQVMHVSPTICPVDDGEFEFVITLQSHNVRLIAPSWVQMIDWVDSIATKLREMRILSPKENIYSKMPEQRPPLLPTRDPNSPLPLPPVGPSSILPGVEPVQSSDGFQGANSAVSPISPSDPALYTRALQRLCRTSSLNETPPSSPRSPIPRSPRSPTCTSVPPTSNNVTVIEVHSSNLQHDTPSTSSADRPQSSSSSSGNVFNFAFVNEALSTTEEEDMFFTPPATPVFPRSSISRFIDPLNRHISTSPSLDPFMPRNDASHSRNNEYISGNNSGHKAIDPFAPIIDSSWLDESAITDSNVISRTDPFAPIISNRQNNSTSRNPANEICDNPVASSCVNTITNVTSVLSSSVLTLSQSPNVPSQSNVTTTLSDTTGVDDYVSMSSDNNSQPLSNRVSHSNICKQLHPIPNRTSSSTETSCKVAPSLLNKVTRTSIESSSKPTTSCSNKPLIITSNKPITLDLKRAIPHSRETNCNGQVGSSGESIPTRMVITSSETEPVVLGSTRMTISSNIVLTTPKTNNSSVVVSSITPSCSSSICINTSKSSAVVISSKSGAIAVTSGEMSSKPNSSSKILPTTNSNIIPLNKSSKPIVNIVTQCTTPNLSTSSVSNLAVSSSISTSSNNVSVVSTKSPTPIRRNSTSNDSSNDNQSNGVNSGGTGSQSNLYEHLFLPGNQNVSVSSNNVTVVPASNNVSSSAVVTPVSSSSQVSNSARSRAAVKIVNPQPSRPRRRSSSNSESNSHLPNVPVDRIRGVSPRLQAVPNPSRHGQEPLVSPSRPLREQQVLKLRREMMHPGGVRLQLRRKDCLGTIALVDAYNAVWIGGWKQKEHPVLYHALHIGDQILKIGGIFVPNATEAQKLIRNSKGLYVEFVILRLPRGRVYAILREHEGQNLGIVQEGTAEIRDIVPNSIVHQNGIKLRTPTMDGLGLTTWWITEINGRPLNLFFKDNEVKDRLNCVGLDISLLIQPYDLVKQIKKQMKSLRGYKDYIVQ